MYSIGVASRLSGVAAETIRIWERRYGLPSPERSQGGHRLYSDGDVELLRAIKHLTEQGVRVGGLAGLRQEEVVRMAFGGEPAAGDEPSDELDFGQLIVDGVEAARALDGEHLAELLGRPLLHRHAEQVVRGLYLPLLREVGELWHAGELSVAAEHLVEKQISGRIHSVLANARPAAPDAPVAVCACVAGERHEVGLLATSVLLNEEGFRVLYLGADLPAVELLGVAEHVRPRLVVLASVVAMAPADQRALAEVLADRSFRRAALVVGGINARALADALPVPAAVCSDIDGVARLARTVLQAS